MPRIFAIGFYTANCFEMISGTALEKKECLSGCCNFTDAVKGALPVVRRRVGASNYVVWSAKPRKAPAPVKLQQCGPTSQPLPPSLAHLLPPALSPSLAPMDPLVKKRHLPVWVGGAPGAEGHHAASRELRLVKQLV